MIYIYSQRKRFWELISSYVGSSRELNNKENDFPPFDQLRLFLSVVQIGKVNEVSISWSGGDGSSRVTPPSYMDDRASQCHPETHDSRHVCRVEKLPPIPFPVQVGINSSHSFQIVFLVPLFFSKLPEQSVGSRDVDERNKEWKVTFFVMLDYELQSTRGGSGPPFSTAGKKDWIPCLVPFPILDPSYLSETAIRP